MPAGPWIDLKFLDHQRGYCADQNFVKNTTREYNQSTGQLSSRLFHDHLLAKKALLQQAGSAGLRIFVSVHYGDMIGEEKRNIQQNGETAYKSQNTYSLCTSPS